MGGLVYLWSTSRRSVHVVLQVLTYSCEEHQVVIRLEASHADLANPCVCPRSNDEEAYAQEREGFRRELAHLGSVFGAVPVGMCFLPSFLFLFFPDRVVLARCVVGDDLGRVSFFFFFCCALPCSAVLKRASR